MSLAKLIRMFRNYEMSEDDTLAVYDSKDDVYYPIEGTVPRYIDPDTNKSVSSCFKGGKNAPGYEEWIKNFRTSQRVTVLCADERGFNQVETRCIQKL